MYLLRCISLYFLLICVSHLINAQLEITGEYSYLAGGRGSDFHDNKLFFMEDSRSSRVTGRLSLIYHIRGTKTPSNPTTKTLLAGSDLSFTSSTAGPYHVNWDGTTLSPIPPYKIVKLPTTEVFGLVTCTGIQSFKYSEIGIPISTADNNAVIAVYNPDAEGTTDEPFDYGKIKIVGLSGTTLNVQYTHCDLKPRHVILGTGYDKPKDIKLAKDGSNIAYITEGTTNGTILKVDLTQPMNGLTCTECSRSKARVLISGLNNPQQLALGDGNKVYTVEESGNLISVSATGVKTVLVSGLQDPSGLVITSDFSTAYVSEVIPQLPPVYAAYRISEIDLLSGATTEVFPTIYGGFQFFYLTWVDESKTMLFGAEMGNNQLQLINTQTLSSSVVIIDPPAPLDQPVSVSVVSPNTIMVVSQYFVYELDLFVNVSGPLFMGIGHIPVTYIGMDGYSTYQSPFISVKDAPFGGLMALKINHVKAQELGGKYYQILYDGTVQRDSWQDDLWTGFVSGFQRQLIKPDANDMFLVRKGSDIWYDWRLGYVLNSKSKTDGLRTITVNVFNSARVLLAHETINVTIDNTPPDAKILAIYHHDLENGTVETVGDCAIVEGTSDVFSFDVSAFDGNEHLNNYVFYSRWGTGKSGTIHSDIYTNHVGVTKKWRGIDNQNIPSAKWAATVAGDPTSRRCSRSFEVWASDRSTTGYGPANYAASFSRHVTLYLD